MDERARAHDLRKGADDSKDSKTELSMAAERLYIAHAHVLHATAALKIKSIATVYLTSLATKRTSYIVNFKLKVVQKAKQK